MFKTLKCPKCKKLYGCVAYEELGEMLCRNCSLAYCSPVSKDWVDHIEQTCPWFFIGEYKPFKNPLDNFSNYKGA